MSMPISEPIELHTEDLQKLETLAASLNISPEVDVESLLNIKVLRKQEELLGLNRDAMRADFYPRASLSGQWIQNTQSNKFNLYTGNALNYSMLNFTLNINIPIYDGGAKRARLDQAKVDLLKQKEEIKGTSNALKMAYESAKIQMKNSLESIHNQKANLELAQEVYDNINNNYRLGLANLTDLLNAEAELTSTQNAYSDALLQFKVAEIELMKARGEIKNLAIN
jgi:outer membrane protein